MNTITNEFTTMRRRHQKAVRSAEQAVDDMLQTLSQVSDVLAQRDARQAAATAAADKMDDESMTESTAIRDDNPPTITRTAQLDNSDGNVNATTTNTTTDASTTAALGQEQGHTGGSNSGVTDGGEGGDDRMQIDGGDEIGDTNVNEDEVVLKVLESLLSKCKSLQSSLDSDYRSVGTAMNKFGKAINNTTETKLGELCCPGLTLNSSKINDAIATHLFREGMFDVGRSFLQETDVQLDDASVKPFEQLHEILTAFRRDDLRPAIEWTRQKHEFLRSNASNLEFRLHCLAYLQILQNEGDRDAALTYARTHLSAFPEYIGHVQKLMTCLLYSKGLSKSPYSALVHPSRRDDIERSLSREYCRAQGLTKDSLLHTVVRCGTKTIPVLLKATRVAPNLHELGMDDALPVEIDVGRDCSFHSIFTCPVSKEEASDGTNVPMILQCGHVLSKQSILRLPRGTSRFKCPYCPMEQSIDDCKELQI